MQKQIINPLVNNEFTACSSCKKSLIGERLKKYEAQFSGEFTHYSLLVPVYDDPGSKLITAWLCPHCGHRVQRFGGADHDTATQEI
jgi:hypothetical protein